MAVEGELRERPFAAGLIGAAGDSGLHPGAWLAWLAGACVAVFLTSNPLYLSLGLLAALGVYLSVRDTAKGRALGTFVALGLALAALSVPFNLLTGSVGPTVLTTLPELTLPRWLGGVTFGGDLTGEALVVAGERALGIATLVVLAGAFNSAIDHFRLLRLAPRGLSQLMLTATLAIVLVPQALAHARSVAEGQRLRGWPARGVRALPGLLLPTLNGALERSVQRAESLDARGFGAGANSAGALAAVVGTAGLGLCSWGAFAYFYYGAGALTALAMAAGVGLVAAALLQGGGTQASRLRADRWTARDVIVAGAALTSIALLLALRVVGAGEVDYLPYPEVSAPAFHVAAAVAFLLLLTPALAILASEVDG